MSSSIKIAIIGGGAAGFFGAIRAAEWASQSGIDAEVLLLENSGTFLKKVRISGGGRCNVTHNCFEVKIFCQNYPRGSKELISPFQKFQAKDTVEWFAQRGVTVVAEEDGRMFPDTNSSETIIQCFLSEVERLGVQLLTHHSVQGIEKLTSGKLKISIRDKESLEVDKVLIATGSSPVGYSLAKELGHIVTELAPSLFSFKIESPLLQELSGLSFANTKLRLHITDAPTFKQNGPLLITHWGLSGPAILKLSAWAAREMMHVDYKAQLTVNWLGLERLEEVQQVLLGLKENNIKSQVKNIHPQDLPKRFWIKLLDQAKVLRDITWADISKKQMAALAEQIFSSRFDILGKNRFKDEFVECGGVSLKEIDFKSMQSKICPGVYFAGELLDIDGITGGFNFQNAWTTSWIAGTHMAGGLNESQ